MATLIATSRGVSSAGLLIKTCYCNRDFTEAEFKDIITQLRKKQDPGKRFIRNPKTNYIIFPDINGKPIISDERYPKNRDLKSEGIVENISAFDKPAADGKPIADRLFYLSTPADLNINEGEANYNNFTEQLNTMFKTYGIKTCLQKIHFFSQSYQETRSFGHTCEEFPKDSYGGGKYYRGRGLLQLTHDYNYKPYFEYWQKIPEKIKLPTYTFPDFIPKLNPPKMMTDFSDFVKSISTDLFFACDSAGWYWKKNNINKYADLDDIRKVSAKVNNPSASENSTGTINGLKERTEIYNLLKPIFEYEKFHK
ncbi:hypothetical protein [Flavobacterium sp.]|uniref:hypothetical protein n=1 Tax=Flavobacterium sp. TaxID=239 RepID=UPI003752EEB1